MTNDNPTTLASAREELVQQWRDAPGLDDPDEWDGEVRAVNSMMAGIDEFPKWALQVRDAMPKYGFEMCSHRWLDGLDEVMGMIGAGAFHPSEAGHCGDIPGRVVDAAVQRANAVQGRLDGEEPARELDRRVAEWLGEPTPEKREAAACFVELVRGYFLMEQKPAEEEARAVTATWRARAESNDTLRLMFEGEGFDGLLENRCGFKLVDRLDLYIRIIGGDRSQASERHGVCNSQLRFVLRDAPAWYETTRGYLWGLQAYLLGRDGEWLLETKPDCAGSAIYALRAVSNSGSTTPLRRWLIASLLKSAKIWCRCVLNNVGEDRAPAYARDLPDVVAAIEE